MGQRAGFDWAKLTMGQKGVLITGVLFLIDMFLPWNRVCVIGFCEGVNGWSGGTGIIAGLLALALVVWEGMNAAGALETVTAPKAMISAALAGGVALFALMRALFNLEFASFGLWIGIILALAMAYAAYVRYQESQLATPPAEAPPPA
jgi:hypothetical protein